MGPDGPTEVFGCQKKEKEKARRKTYIHLGLGPSCLALQTLTSCAYSEFGVIDTATIVHESQCVILKADYC